MGSQKVKKSLEHCTSARATPRALVQLHERSCNEPPKWFFTSYFLILLSGRYPPKCANHIYPYWFLTGFMKRFLCRFSLIGSYEMIRITYFIKITIKTRTLSCDLISLPIRMFLSIKSHSEIVRLHPKYFPFQEHSCRKAPLKKWEIIFTRHFCTVEQYSNLQNEKNYNF